MTGKKQAHRQREKASGYQGGERKGMGGNKGIGNEEVQTCVQNKL